MGAQVRRSPLVFFLAVISLSGACGSNTTMAPTPTPNPALPQPVSPANNASIAQNNASIGCSLLPGNKALAGLGFQIQYNWSAPLSVSGVVGYELVVQHGSSPSLYRTVTGTGYTETECNTFVNGINLLGWQWQVRAHDAQRQPLTDWSPWATFNFIPCVLSDGTSCRSES